MKDAHNRLPNKYKDLLDEEKGPERVKEGLQLKVEESEKRDISSSKRKEIWKRRIKRSRSD